MAKIQILDDTLASQVAAGEVVERPASVVKELVENSLDAGASHVTVEIQRGGTARIKVRDDGSGMSKEDALLSLERHATSKLRTSEELASVMTLGFRGEAVPSIASVSKFRLTTREKDSVSGTGIVVIGGSVKDVREAGAPEGTSIEVEQIFFNVPARRKFLRAETTEAAHVEHQARLHALAAPKVRFTLIKDGRTVFDLPGTSDWRVRIAGLTGNESASKLIEVPSRNGQGARVRGYLLPAEFARKGRRQQYVFLNGRPIEDAAVARALRDGYRGAIAEGNHPAAWLWIDMDPGLVDVNVHPAKREVRFHRPHDVRNLIAAAVEHALRDDAQPEGIDAPEKQPRSPDFEPRERVGFSGSENATVSLGNETKLSGEVERNDLSSNTESSPATFPHQAEQQQSLTDGAGASLIKRPVFEIIGPLHDRYVVMQGEEGVVLLDPVAARERVVYENLLQASQADGVDAQGLLVPELLELETLDAELVLRNAEHFAEAGMTVEDFGGSTVKVNSIPAFLNVADVRKFLLELVDELHEAVGGKRTKTMAYEVFAASVARRVGKHEPCRIDHAESLLDAMFACDLPYCTPDGRPTIIHISLNELDRKFGR